MRDYTKYDIWTESIELSIRLYDYTRLFPNEEKYGLVSQIRRSAISIPSNIAEGASRSSEKDFKRFIEISLGSSFELKTQLIIAQKLKYIQEEQLIDLLEIIDKVGKQLNTLRNKLK